ASDEGQTGRAIGDRANHALGDIDHVSLAARVDLAHDITRAMVVLVQVGEEVQHRDVTRIKGAVIGGTVSVTESGDAEWCSRFERGTGRPAVRTVEQRGQLSRGRDAVYDQLVVTQPADHVEVDHGDGAVERYGTVGDEVLGAEEAHFL